jgi:PAS domain S-box-containing protein
MPREQHLPVARRYFDEFPCYVCVQDRDLRIIEANRRFTEDFGEGTGRCCYQVLRQRDAPCEDCPVLLTFEDGQRRTHEAVLRCLDGREVAIIAYTSPLRNDAGEIVAVMEMCTDITEVKRLEAELRRRGERYRTLFEEVPCYISVQDREFRIVEANRRFREDFGDGVGEPCFRVYKHRSEPCQVCPVARTFRDGEIHQSEEVVTAKDGRKVNVLCYAAPIRNADGRIEHVMEMSANITDVRQLQSQLASLGLLIGSISHGIKGLLTGLDGGSYLVTSGFEREDMDRVRRGWEMVQRNMQQIRSMVLDILYYAKDRELIWEPVDTVQIAEDVAGIMRTRAERYGVEFVRDFAKDAGTFQGDRAGIHSVLVNLLENSLDACRTDVNKDAHHVHFAVRGGSDQVVFEVSDNGIGMDQETREKAFCLFFSSKGQEGTGLGLFIANKIVTQHGGTIRIDSQLGEGTRFVVRLYRHRPAEAKSNGKDRAEGAEQEAPRSS